MGGSADRGAGPSSSEEQAEYRLLVEVEALESLLEELEDLGITGIDDGESTAVPADLRGAMDDAGARDVQQLRARIMHLHAQIDNDDSDLTVSES